MLSIVEKKENNKELDFNELETIFNGYLKDLVTDEVMTRLLKAICKNGMSEKEIIALTEIFIHSGDVLDLSRFNPTVDKHSTGGIGDKVTLLLLPFLVGFGFYVVKMSGRGLGYTGGTIDKLESIDGFVTNLSEDEVFKQASDIHVVLTSQTKNLCPLDKKVYALRDVTNTTNSIGLIASSIMSKKIASGAKNILIDVKVGEGALVANLKEAMMLSNIMKKIGNHYDRNVICMITRMDEPLGNAVGNMLEVLEVEDILLGKQENEIIDLVKNMCVLLVNKVFGLDKNLIEKQFYDMLNSKKAYEIYKSWILAQHGTFTRPNLEGVSLVSNKTGYIKNINAKEIGICSMMLGAGRKNKEDKIDYNAGIVVHKKIGDYVKKGEAILTYYGKKEIDEQRLLKAFKVIKMPVIKKKRIIKVIK